MQNHISNAITNQPENSGRNLGNLLAGFDDGVKACGESDCDTWWKWLLSPGICLFDMLVVCIIDWIGGTSTVWEGSTIAIYKTETTPLEYLPDCYSFQFPAMTFSPTVDITVNIRKLYMYIDTRYLFPLFPLALQTLTPMYQCSSSSSALPFLNGSISITHLIITCSNIHNYHIDVQALRHIKSFTAN